MKRLCFTCIIISALLGFYTGCGKKGAPVAPVVPQPLPVQELSARVEADGILLSWTPPQVYDTEKPLELDDIRSFHILRTAETPASNSWDFSESVQGWSTAGKTFPIKRHKGLLRTASREKTLLLTSPKGLDIAAQEHRYIRLQLWTRHCQQGSLVFITKNDSSWDHDADMTFHPAAHTSFYTYRHAFYPLKLKPFLLSRSSAYGVQEYVLDMQTVPAWKGTIKQVGVLLNNAAPGDALAELGLERIEFLETLEETASLYESPPWLFLQDEEGWSFSPTTGIAGASDSVLYAQSNETLALLSKPGQQILIGDDSQAAIRMKVTEGGSAYLVYRTGPEDAFPAFDSIPHSDSPHIVEFPLSEGADFFTYRVDLHDRSVPGHAAMEKSLYQIALVFPEITGIAERHILVDGMTIISPGTGDQPSPSLPIQQHIPPAPIVKQHVLARLERQYPDFDLSYDALPASREKTAPKELKLADILPQDPEPATLQDGRFFLTDTGAFSTDEEQDASLTYGARYTYQIEVVDRKRRTSPLSDPVTIAFSRIPTDPKNLRADAGDEQITLSWERPVLTQDGQKIRTLAGYTIFRSDDPQAFPSRPVTRVPGQLNRYTDKNLHNGKTYYYTIRSIVPGTGNVSPDADSEVVAAMPQDIVPPEVPTGVVGVYTDGMIELYWNQSQVGDFAGFHVYRSQNPRRAFTKINAEPVLQASFTDTDVEEKRVYYYYVTSFDTESPPNESEGSKIATVETFVFE